MDFVRQLAKKPGFSERQIVGWLDMARGKYFGWARRYGKANEYNAHDSLGSAASVAWSSSLGSGVAGASYPAEVGETCWHRSSLWSSSGPAPY